MTRQGRLTGVRIVELAGLGTTPQACVVLAGLGAMSGASTGPAAVSA